MKQQLNQGFNKLIPPNTFIHGIGKGKLKQAVENYLRFHGAVVSFKNEFFEKYGFGATRVGF